MKVECSERSFKIRQSNGYSFTLAGQYYCTPSAVSSALPLTRLLFIHGFGDNCGIWKALIEAMARNCQSPFEALALDFAGHGMSDHKSPTDSYTLWSAIEDIELLVEEHLQWSRFSIISHSLGALIAAWYSVIFHEKIVHLVQFDQIGIIRSPPLTMDAPIYGPKTSHHKSPVLPYELVNAVEGAKKYALDPIDFRNFLEMRKSKKPVEAMQSVEQAMKIRQQYGNDGISLNGAKALMTRGLKKNVDGKYVWTYDPAIMLGGIDWIQGFSSADFRHLSSYLQAKVLVIIAGKS